MFSFWKRLATETKSAPSVLRFGITRSLQPTLCRASLCTGLLLAINEDTEMAELIINLIMLFFN